MKEQLKMREDVMKMIEDVMKMIKNVITMTKGQTLLLHVGRKQDSSLKLNRTPTQIRSHVQVIQKK
jgi:hypothetical protein